MKRLRRKKMTELQIAKRKLASIRQIIENVDLRCMAADGDVTRTKDEITDWEIRGIYKMAAPVRIRKK